MFAHSKKLGILMAACVCLSLEVALPKAEAQQNGFAMVKILNAERQTQKYFLKWGDGNWSEEQTIAGFNSRSSWFPVDGAGNAPTLTISFSPGDGAERMQRALTTKQVQNTDSDDGAARYEFYRGGGNSVNIRESNPPPATDSDRDRYCKLALLYLNIARKDPADFGQRIGVDLSMVKPREALVWNDTLARVAQQKAQDMADRNYFDHINLDGLGINVLMNNAGYTLPADWLEPKDKHFFESIHNGLDYGPWAVKSLIVDDNTPSLGHRIHLLGMDDWNSKMVAIGIGCGRNPKISSKTYYCVVTGLNQ